MPTDSTCNKPVYGIRIYPDSIEVVEGVNAPILLHDRVDESISDFFYIFRCMTPVLGGMYVADSFTGEFALDGSRIDQEPELRTRYGRSLVAFEEERQFMILHGGDFINWGKRRYNCGDAFLPIFSEVPSFDVLPTLFWGDDKQLRAGDWPATMRGFFYMWDDIYWEYYSVEQNDIDRLIEAHGQNKNLTLFAVDISIDYPEPRNIKLPDANLSEHQRMDSPKAIYQEQKIDLTDDFGDLVGWVGISSGDIYFGTKPFGYYWGYWRPNLDEAGYIVVNIVNERLEVTGAIGVEVASGQPLVVKAVEEADQPWGVELFEGYISPRDIPSYSTAVTALDLIEDIVANDVGLAKFLLDPTISAKP